MLHLAICIWIWVCVHDNHSTELYTCSGCIQLLKNSDCMWLHLLFCWGFSLPVVICLNCFFFLFFSLCNLITHHGYEYKATHLVIHRFYFSLSILSEFIQPIIATGILACLLVSNWIIMSGGLLSGSKELLKIKILSYFFFFFLNTKWPKHGLEPSWIWVVWSHVSIIYSFWGLVKCHLTCALLKGVIMK